MHGILGERYADRIADAIGQQAADADCALDSSVIAVSGFGDSKMDRIIPVRPFGIEPCDEQAVGFDHDLWVRGLHREDEFVIIEFAGDAGEFEGALDHAERRVPVAVHDPVAQAAVIGPDPHGDTAFFAELDQRAESLADACDLGFILVVRVFPHVEFFGIREVAGIDPDFIHPLGRFERRVGFEMDVGNERDGAAGTAEFLADILQIFGILNRRRRDSHDLASDCDESKRLFDTGRCVHRVACQHRLDADGIGSANRRCANAHFSRGSTSGIRAVDRNHRATWFSPRPAALA